MQPKWFWYKCSQNRNTFESQVCFVGTWLLTMHSQEVLSRLKKNKYQWRDFIDCQWGGTLWVSTTVPCPSLGGYLVVVLSALLTLIPV